MTQIARSAAWCRLVFPQDVQPLVVYRAQIGLARERLILYTESESRDQGFAEPVRLAAGIPRPRDNAHFKRQLVEMYGTILRSDDPRSVPATTIGESAHG